MSGGPADTAAARVEALAERVTSLLFIEHRHEIESDGRTHPRAACSCDWVDPGDSGATHSPWGHHRDDALRALLREALDVPSRPTPADGLREQIEALVETAFDCETADDDGRHKAVPVEHLRSALANPYHVAATDACPLCGRERHIHPWDDCPGDPESEPGRYVAATDDEPPRCICDGAIYLGPDENAARHPFIVNPDCPVHAADVGARDTTEGES